jgi:hypothetical protein
MISKLLLLVALATTTTHAADDFMPCVDKSTPTCRDGSALVKGEFPPCKDGKPVCADGSTAAKPPHPYYKKKSGKPGGKPHGIFMPCADKSMPTCPDGSALVKGKFPPCKDGKPVCADGSTAAKPPHPHHKNKKKSGKPYGQPHSQPHGTFTPCTDKSTPVCPDGSALVKGKFPPCKDGKPVCADGSTAAKPPHPHHKKNGQVHQTDENQAGASSKMSEINHDTEFSKQHPDNLMNDVDEKQQQPQRNGGRLGHDLAIGIGSFLIGMTVMFLGQRCCCRRNNNTPTTIIPFDVNTPRIVVLGAPVQKNIPCYPEIMDVTNKV